MNRITFENISPNQYLEILDLYRQEGWTNYIEDANYIKDMINKSTYTIGAYQDEKLVGYIRGFSDDYSIHFIQDLIMKESHKRNGIGSLLIKTACERYKKVRKTVLLSEEDAQEFYISCGFKHLYEGACFIKSM